MASPFDAAAVRKHDGMSTAFLYQSKPDAHVSHLESHPDDFAARESLQTQKHLPVARSAPEFLAQHDTRPSMHDAIPKRRQPAMSGFSYTSDDDDTICNYLERVKSDEKLAEKLERSTRSVQQRIQVLVRKNQRQLEELADAHVPLPPFAEQDELRLYYMLRDGQTLERAGLVLQRSEASLLRRLRKLQETRRPGHFIEIDRILAEVDPHVRKYDSYDSASDDGSWGSWPSYDSEPAEPMRADDSMKRQSGDTAPPPRSTVDDHRSSAAVNNIDRCAAAPARGNHVDGLAPTTLSTARPPAEGFARFSSQAALLPMAAERPHTANGQRQLDTVERMGPGLVPEMQRTRPSISTSAPPLTMPPPRPAPPPGRPPIQPLPHAHSGTVGSSVAILPHPAGSSIAVAPPSQPSVIGAIAAAPSSTIPQSVDPRLRPKLATASTIPASSPSASSTAIPPLPTRQSSESTSVPSAAPAVKTASLRPWSDAQYEKGMAGLKRFLDLVNESSSRKRARATEP
ncbi:hypothetical protein BMF94_1876 [Rhodotorula taiwanensis]|uniref:Uncharacterized protein n=1 Tax=Rhodotorula taiwanensis TaxID=741276 RepID=A0A2S5BDQ6_9BASI|nr:hypothetical protein BMF94_1876 [Rhodotorula taiwanensis]